MVKLYDEEQKRFLNRVPEDELQVPARKIPLPSKRLLLQLKYGELEFTKLHKRYSKWMYELRTQRKQSFRDLVESVRTHSDD